MLVWFLGWKQGQKLQENVVSDIVVSSQPKFGSLDALKKGGSGSDDDEKEQKFFVGGMVRQEIPAAISQTPFFANRGGTDGSMRPLQSEIRPNSSHGVTCARGSTTRSQNTLWNPS
jgi:hypothetical protein